MNGLNGRRFEVGKIIIILLVIGGVAAAIQESESIIAKIGIGCLALVIVVIAVLSVITGVGPVALILRVLIGL